MTEHYVIADHAGEAVCVCGNVAPCGRGMRFAIADPPYLGRAERHYGIGANQRRGMFGSGPARSAKNRTDSHHATTEHPDAAEWDDPLTHQQLVTDLVELGYDGWAIAMWPDSLPIYLAVAPEGARVGAWVKHRPVPGGSRIITGWEPVLFFVPAERRGRGSGESVRDTLICAPGGAHHVGAKPIAWTRWVLAVLGYNQELDTVDDLFPGSGAVTNAIAQLTLGTTP